MHERRPAQSEQNPWQKELSPHREIGGTLKPDETLALMGSWTEENLDNIHQLQEGMDEKDYQRAVRIHEAALTELSLLDVDDTNVLSAISDRRAMLEQEVLEHARHADIPSKIAAQFRLEGLKALESIYARIEDSVRAANDKNRTSLENTHARAEIINELIAEHNKWIHRGLESVVDSPEVREAQERTTELYSEIAGQQQQSTETVGDARQKVAEVFSGIAETEKEPLLSEVTKVAKGTTRIYTDIPSGILLRSTEGDYQPIDGFNSFGDGLPPESLQFRREMMRDRESVEAVLFEPDTEGVKVTYQFDASGTQYALDTYEKQLPEYKTESGRSGNMLFVEVTLPNPVAEKLKQAVLRSPEVARELAKRLALNNGIPEQVWNDVVRPPYEQLPDDWGMAITDLQKDTRFGAVRHQVASRQSVRVGP